MNLAKTALKWTIGFAALLCLGVLIGLGFATAKRLPTLSHLWGAHSHEADWCDAHSVPESQCIECNSKLWPKPKTHGWCKTHGVHECVLCHPELAQTQAAVAVTAEDRAIADRALTTAPRIENSSKCNLHERRIQVVSPDVMDQLGIRIAQTGRSPVTETISAPGEIIIDPARVARVSSRVPGTIWQVGKQVGDKVHRGEILALVEAAEVGRAKAEFQQAMTNLDAKRLTLTALQASTTASSRKNIQVAEADIEEARIRLLSAEQALLNLGLVVHADDVKSLPPRELAQQLQFLGLPSVVASNIAGKTSSSNLIAITSPLDGEIVDRSAAAGEATDPTKPMFIVADTGQLLLTLRVKLEDANRIQPGQEIRFQHAGHAGWDGGTVQWISPAADEKSRTVTVRAELPNPVGRHHANTVGTAQIVLRFEPNAVVVPSSAVHWEGDCNVVFVRDKNFDVTDAPKFFHVRKVRPGVQDVVAGTPMTEIIVGLLPGEWVATANSTIFRTELLKNNLGAG